MSQWPKWLRRQYGKLEICGSSPGYDTNFSLKNYHQKLSDIKIFNINVMFVNCRQGAKGDWNFWISDLVRNPDVTDI